MDQFDKLRKEREFQRSFLPEDADLGQWETIAPYFEALLKRSLDSVAELERWLLDQSELLAAIEEEAAVRYIRMTCHTDDLACEAAYLHYVEHVLPEVERARFALNRYYVAAPARSELPPERYFVYDRARRNEVELFREENVALKTEDEKLSQRYQKIYGEMTAEFQGREQTLPQLSRYLEETDRGVRRDAWCAATARQLRDREEIESLFDEMIALRTQIAHNAGFENFLEYQFRNLGRFDYTPADCEALHATIERTVVPLVRAMRERRRQQLGLARLAPWDLAVDPLGRPPLRPFEGVEQLVSGVRAVFAAVDPRFAEEFDILRERGLLDLDSRKGKAPGGYQSTLDEVRLPFIFMNAAGRNRDVFTLLHEGGHAFHALATRTEPLLAYRHAPIEFCEVASMGMEMMACECLSVFYSPEDAQRARTMHLEEVLEILPWIARVDAFQHWLYRNPKHTRQERAAMWLELERRFGDELEWSELPEWRECSWIGKLHFFCVPLYYIEYAIAQIGALQLWERFRGQREQAIEGYRSALRLGGARPLPELFETAGSRFAFDEATVAPLAQQVAVAIREDEK